MDLLIRLLTLIVILTAFFVLVVHWDEERHGKAIEIFVRARLAQLGISRDGKAKKNRPHRRDDSSHLHDQEEV